VAFQLSALAHFRIHHQPARIICPNRQEPLAKKLWNLPYIQIRLSCPLTHENRPRCLVWGIDRVMRKGEQDDSLARLRVNQADAAGKSGLLVGDTSASAKCG